MYKGQNPNFFDNWANTSLYLLLLKSSLNCLRSLAKQAWEFQELTVFNAWADLIFPRPHVHLFCSILFSSNKLTSTEFELGRIWFVAAVQDVHGDHSPVWLVWIRELLPIKIFFWLVESNPVKPEWSFPQWWVFSELWHCIGWTMTLYCWYYDTVILTLWHVLMELWHCNAGTMGMYWWNCDTVMLTQWQYIDGTVTL